MIAVQLAQLVDASNLAAQWASEKVGETYRTFWTMIKTIIALVADSILSFAEVGIDYWQTTQKDPNTQAPVRCINNPEHARAVPKLFFLLMRRIDFSQ